MHYYIGTGDAYMVGVPARDLSNPEWEALDEDTRKALLNAKMFTGKRPEGHVDTHPDKVAEANAPAEAPAKESAKGEATATPKGG